MTINLVSFIEGIPAHREAPCWTSGEPDQWTSDSRKDRARAAALCSSQACPILDACLAGAMARLERHGVWGGVDVETHYQDHGRGRKRPPRPACGTHNGYKAHRRRGEVACQPCSQANSAYVSKAKAAKRAAKRAAVA